MWPIPALELVDVCGGTCSHREQLASLSIDAASVGDVAPAAGQIFVPVADDTDAHSLVGVALSAGVSLALVDSAWAQRAVDDPALLDPALLARCVAVPDVLRAYRALAAHLRRGFTFPVIAIAGSSGKTTTKELTSALLTAAGLAVSKTPQTMNGFTGVPYTLCLPGHHRDHPPDALVLEIGIDAIGAMADHARLADPDVAAITALGIEHLDGLQSAERAASEERLLFEAARRRVWQADDVDVRRGWAPREGDIVVAHADSPLEAPPGVAVLRHRTRRSSPSATETIWHYQSPSAAPLEGETIAPLGGAHNARNVAVAMGAALASGADPSVLLQARRLAVSVPTMRCQVIDTAGPTLIDDCYNANPASVAAALSLLGAAEWRHRPHFVVLGDMLELGAQSGELHRALVPTLPPARYLMVGEAMRPVARALDAPWLARSAAAEDIVAQLAPTADGVVLVKGSRGMRLERVVRALVGGPTATRGEARVAVVGRDREAIAWLGAAALGRAGCADVGAYEARSLVHAPRGMAAALFGGFSLEHSLLENGLVPPKASPEEFQLALFAQPFMHLAEGGVALFAATDPLSELLAAALPAHACALTFGLDDGADVRGELRGDVLWVHAESHAAQPIPWPETSGSPLPAVAALALALALGDDLGSAAAALAAATLRA